MTSMCSIYANSSYVWVYYKLYKCILFFNYFINAFITNIWNKNFYSIMMYKAIII